MTFTAGSGADAAWMTIAHDHENGLATFRLECPHGRSEVTLRLDLGDEFPDEPGESMMMAQAGIHERSYTCGCAIRFLSIQQTMTDGRRSDA